MTASQPILIGYFSRQVDPAPKPPTAPPHVQEICNAGLCGGTVPEGWRDLWLHNEFWLYDSELLAWAVAIQTENLRRLLKNWDGIAGSIQATVERFVVRHVPPPSAPLSWENQEPRWELFAYRLFPTLFVAGDSSPVRLPSRNLGPLSPDYERIGYDAVSVPGPRPEVPLRCGAGILLFLGITAGLCFWASQGTCEPEQPTVEEHQAQEAMGSNIYY